MWISNSRAVIQKKRFHVLHWLLMETPEKEGDSWDWPSKETMHELQPSRPYNRSGSLTRADDRFCRNFTICLLFIYHFISFIDSSSALICIYIFLYFIFCVQYFSLLCTAIIFFLLWRKYLLHPFYLLFLHTSVLRPCFPCANQSTRIRKCTD